VNSPPSTRRPVREDRSVKTLRQRLLFTLLAWLALVLIVFCAVVFLLARQNLQGDIDQFVRDKAYILGQQVNPAYPTGIFYDERPWRSDRYFAFGQTFDTNWNLLYKSTRLVEPILPTEDLKRYATHPTGVVLHDATGPDGTHYRMATVRIERKGKFVCYSQHAVRLSERDAPLHRLLLWLAGCTVAALLLAWLGLNHLVRQWSAPLAALTETARKVDLGNLSRQRLFAPADAPELAQFAASFNDLLERVEAAHASQHRFVAAASHELRTPLTILRGEIDVALRRPRSPEEYTEVLQSSREEIERLSRLTDSLLTLARADAGEILVRREAVDVSTVAHDVCRKLATLSDQRHVPLTCEAQDSAVVSGDSVALEQIVFNLAENALRYTPSGEGATVRVNATAEEVLLEVSDHGSGIAAEHLPHLFERFYRVNKARSREFGGAGLGLSIVKTLAEAHGGRVEVRSKVGKGSTFTVRLPRASGSMP
jgi:two-component system OmpR family sensor kinase